MDASAKKDQGPAGGLQHGDHLRHVRGRRLIAEGGAELRAGSDGQIGFRARIFAPQHVFRQGQGRGALSASRGLTEGLADQAGQQSRGGDGGIPLGHGRKKPLLIAVGQGIGLNAGHGDLRGQADQGDVGAVSLAQARHHVKRAASGGHLHYAHLAGDPGVGVGGVGRVPLIPAEDVADLLLPQSKSVVKSHAGVSGNAKDHLYALFNQHFHQNIRASHRQPSLTFFAKR